MSVRVWRLLAVVLFVIAVPFGLLFVDVLVTKITAGDARGYVGIVLWCGLTASLVFSGRACLQADREKLH